MLGAHQDARRPQNRHVLSKRNARFPPRCQWPPNRDILIKYALIAQRDARWPPKHHVQTKINAECPPNDTPGAKKNATWPAKETPGD